jgi:uncharacterized membrane-anchored protein YhcB (DUF1043 family)
MFLFGLLVGIAVTLLAVNLGKAAKKKAEDQILGKEEAEKHRKEP